MALIQDLFEWSSFVNKKCDNIAIESHLEGVKKLSSKILFYATYYTKIISMKCFLNKGSLMSLVPIIIKFTTPDQLKNKITAPNLQ
jgi:hypothetical protein